MKTLHIIALLIIGVAIMGIVMASGSYSTYATFAKAASNAGKFYQVNGYLCEDKQLYYEPQKDPNYFSFCMKDKSGSERTVVYKGMKPQDFERSEEVVLQGSWEGEEFLASKILLKCPSKYNDGTFKEGEYEMKEYEANTI